MSLDGYIADKNGSVDWLTGQGTDEENVDTYSEFVKDIDTVVMGWNTYAQVITELSPGKWPYENLTSYIITHRNEKPAEKIRFVREDPCELIMRLRKMQGKNIWICGGAGIIHPLIKGNLIDEYYISVIPAILGDGIPLFGKRETEIQLQLKYTRTYSGITELVYIRRE